jgi:hypothetical protein
MCVPVVGIVFVESSWVRQTGMSTLLESKGPSGDVRIIFVTSYNISDSTFAEIVFYPKALDGHWVKLYIPKSLGWALGQAVHSKAGNHCDNGLGES